MTDRPDPAQDVAARIRAAAFATFVEQGFTGASTLKIATRAKVSKRDLYAHFGSKLGMLQACIADRALRLQPPKPPPTPADLAELIATLALLGTRVLQEVTDPGVVAMQRLAAAEALQAPEIGQELEAVRRQLRESVGEWLARAQARRLLPDGDPLEMARVFLALLLSDLVLRLAQGVATRPSPAEADAAAAEAAAAFARLYPTS